MKLPTWFSGTSRHEQSAERYWPQVKRISALEERMKALSDAELKQVVAQHKGKDLAEIRQATDEIFAAVREASRRTLKMRHFDVQLLGGLTLLDHMIAEMKTGEGKTLVATLPLTVHALTGKGAHLITVNDYLSQRDAEWMRPVYEFFDLSVGVVQPGMTPEEKRAAYAADITYGTNNEYGFDYLRDNMAPEAAMMVQRPLHFGIVDEVDSILIDEARTPLIISAPDTESTHLYQDFARLVPQLEENTHYNIDEKRRSATLTDEGISYVEKLLGVENIYAEHGVRTVHHLEQALRAQTLYHRDRDYVTKEGQVMIVDEFTGRLMQGRRYSGGLHQAIEAKEGVAVQQESRTLATITFQNFFRLYDHLAGMTGTAVTSAEEFEKVYNLEVAVVPTHKQIQRNDKTDRIYTTEEAKFNACVEEIAARHKAGQPVLVGTIAIEKSEYLSTILKQRGVPHEVLNAKQHEREAEIVAQAGAAGAVTISTNMAGRGTDIKLGEGVADRGGLFVLGTERHEARRIDNQLRGRSGRQGDPGETQFFVSLEDDVMRVFGGERLKRVMERLNVPENEPIENRLISRTLEGAQERVEGYYFDMRKQVLAYDDVLSRQREAIYTLRRNVVADGVWRETRREPLPLAERIAELVGEQAEALVAAHTGENDPEEWNVEEIAESAHSLSGVPLETVREAVQKTVTENIGETPENIAAAVSEAVAELMRERLTQREQELGESFASLLRAATIRAIDTHWMDHLDTMDYLRTGIGLRGYGQRDPLIEYQREGYQLFQQLMGEIKTTIVETVFKAQAVRQETIQGQAQHPNVSVLESQAADPGTALGAALQPAAAAATAGSAVASATSEGGQLKNQFKNVGRNDLCPCGSGLKFKRCHGKA